MSKRRGCYVYQAVAQASNRDAGHLAYGLTKEQASKLGRKITTMAIAVRRVTVPRATRDRIAKEIADLAELNRRQEEKR